MYENEDYNEADFYEDDEEKRRENGERFCNICGRWLDEYEVNDDDGDGGYCDECLHEIGKDFESIADMVDRNKDNHFLVDRVDVGIYEILTEIFTEDEMNEILLAEAVKRSKENNYDFSRYLESSFLIRAFYQ